MQSVSIRDQHRQQASDDQRPEYPTDDPNERQVERHDASRGLDVRHEPRIQHRDVVANSKVYGTLQSQCPVIASSLKLQLFDSFVELNAGFFLLNGILVRSDNLGDISPGRRRPGEGLIVIHEEPGSREEDPHDHEREHPGSAGTVAY